LQIFNRAVVQALRKLDLAQIIPRGAIVALCLDLILYKAEHFRDGHRALREHHHRGNKNEAKESKFG
jgi:hypothetical protein